MAYMLHYYYYIAAAATTAIAGILHIMLVPNIIGRNLNSGIFFIIAGIAQIFWIIPMLMRWGRALVLYRNSWYHNTNYNMGYYKNARKSYYWKRRAYK